MKILLFLKLFVNIIDRKIIHNVSNIKGLVNQLQNSGIQHYCHFFVFFHQYMLLYEIIMDSEQNTHKLTKMQVRDFSLLNKVSTILSSSLNLKESLEKIFELLESTIDIQKGLICLSDSAQKELKIELAYGLSSEDSSGDNIFIWKQYSELIFTDQSDVIIENLANEGSLFKKYYTNLAAQSFIGTPITIGHVHYGVLCVKCDIVPDTESTRRLELLKFFSLLIAQELKLKSLLESERDAILTENNLQDSDSQ